VSPRHRHALQARIRAHTDIGTSIATSTRQSAPPSQHESSRLAATDPIDDTSTAKLMEGVLAAAQRCDLCARSVSVRLQWLQLCPAVPDDHVLGWLAGRRLSGERNVRLHGV
jgi:hypothetical protein